MHITGTYDSNASNFFSVIEFQFVSVKCIEKNDIYWWGKGM